MSSNGTAVTVKVQEGLAADLLRPARIRDDPLVIALLKRFQGGESNLVMSDAGTMYAVALAAAGYITLEYEAHGRATCSVTEMGTALLQSLDD